MAKRIIRIDFKTGRIITEAKFIENLEEYGLNLDTYASYQREFRKKFPKTSKYDDNGKMKKYNRKEKREISQNMNENKFFRTNYLNKLDNYSDYVADIDDLKSILKSFNGEIEINGRKNGKKHALKKIIETTNKVGGFYFFNVPVSIKKGKIKFRFPTLGEIKGNAEEIDLFLEDEYNIEVRRDTTDKDVML
jgi:oligoribonuclease (3'-5' exoribonuclease)